MARVYVGSFVRVINNEMGIGKLTAVSPDRKSADVTYFHSAHKQETFTYPIENIKGVTLEHQSRCYTYNFDTEQWIMGRAMRFVDDEYEVDFPDAFSQYLPPSKLFVRCNTSLPDPIEVLSILGQETAFFHERRARFLKSLMKQRAVARGMTGLISSNIALMAHQVEVVRRVLEDPVPRYLLADEVGLGKTIEAGVILRQMLLDNPSHKALILVPPFLLSQWEEELINRCQIDQFTDRVKFAGIGSLDKYKNTLPDIVIIDEAHEVARMAFAQDQQTQKTFAALKEICHRANALLLLSATPVLNNEREFLSVLNLLDPEHYRIDDEEVFRLKVNSRREVGRILLSFREDTKPFLLRRGIANLRTMFSHDINLLDMLALLEEKLEEWTEEYRLEQIRRIRVHISETYRLHRRMLRNQRESVAELFSHSRGTNEVLEEFDLDERSPDVHQALDEYRQEAWASERDLWEDEQTTESDLFYVWLTLVQAAMSNEALLRDAIKVRQSGNAAAHTGLEGAFSEIALDRLKSVPLYAGEAGILSRLLKVISDRSEDGDKFDLLLQSVQSIQNKAKRTGKQSKKIVVFTLYTRVCTELVAKLQEALGDDVVGGYHANMNREEIEQVTESFRAHNGCQILICDHSGEVGRNFQFADHIIHYDLPFAPNRLEQRIGRLDRLGRDKPFTMSVLTGPDAAINYQFAWHTILKDGLGLYRSSISSLQFFIDAQMPLILRELYVQGLVGVEEMAIRLQEQIEQEKFRLAEQQVIDEIDARENQASTFFERLTKYESEPESIRQATEPWICESLLFELQRGDRIGQTRYQATERTLVPTRHLLHLHSQMDRPGFYDRNQSVNVAGSKLFRIGDPFFDTLSNYLRWDDRGQTYAIWRKVKGWSVDRDWLGFRLHFIVEGDTGPIKRLLESRGKTFNKKAYERIMDKFLEPTYVTISLDYQGNQADSEHESIMAAQFCELTEGGTDTNIIKERLRFIRNTFTSSQWKARCAKALDTAHRRVLEESSFIEMCGVNADRARTYYHYMKIQVELRNRYEQDWGDQEQFDDEEVAAIIEGIETPNVHLDSSGFFVLSGKELRKAREREARTS